MNVYFNKIKIQNGQTIDLEDVQSKPTIEYISDDCKLYTLMMVDPDSPNSDDPINKYYLHLLIINTSDNIVKFLSSTPSIGSGIHRYFFYLFEQENTIQLPCDYIIELNERIKFDVNYFVDEYKLKEIASVMYKTELLQLI